MSGKRVLLAAVVALTGCFNEELPQGNLTGTVVIPGDYAADITEIGQVYLGLFEGFDPYQLGYPYPKTGPRVGDNPIGDALPYGGTTVGTYAYACYRALNCQVLTGRYDSLQAILDKYPVELESGDMATEEDLFDQCTWYYGWNGLAEFNFIGDGQLDFVKNGDGDWEAPFQAWNTEAPAGAILWGFVDNDFTTCNIDQGVVNRRREDDDNFFREGTNFVDVLNFPDKYITPGDWISETPVVLEADQRDGYQIVLDYVRD